MSVTARTLRLLAEVRGQIDGVLDAQTRDLVRAWVIAWDEIEPDLTASLLEQLVAGDKVTRAQLLRSTRLRKALAVVAEKLEELAEYTGIRISQDLQLVLDTAGGAQASVIDSQLPANFMSNADLQSWSRVDERQLTAIVERITEQVTSTAWPLAPDSYEVVRRELVRGVAAGANPRETARRMIERAGRGFNGGLNRALVISRTETLDAYRTAAAVGEEQHTDVLAGWRWVAELDTRTCPSCWSQHGSMHALTEPGPYDHQQGRCARMPATRSWADLGFTAIEEPPSLLPDARTQFSELTDEQQREVLGPRRFEAWAAGKFPMDSWSRRRSTDGWRDSYVPTKAPKFQSGGRVSPSAA